MNVIGIRGVTKRFASVTAVDDLTLEAASPDVKRGAATRSEDA